jgi:hypothetical protein
MSFPKTEVEQPPRHLRGYEKPYLKAGESKTVEFTLVGVPHPEWSKAHCVAQERSISLGRQTTDLENPQGQVHV